MLEIIGIVGYFELVVAVWHLVYSIQEWLPKSAGFLMSLMSIDVCSCMRLPTLFRIYTTAYSRKVFSLSKRMSVFL